MQTATSEDTICLCIQSKERWGQQSGEMAIVSANEAKKSPTWRLELERDGYTVLEGVLSQSEVEVARLVTNHLWNMCQKRVFRSGEISEG